MKNLLVYYSAILIPLLILFLLMNKINSVTFSVAILVWAGIYRPVVDGIRLIELGCIKKKDFWKTFLPFYKVKWFSKLYR